MLYFSGYPLHPTEAALLAKSLQQSVNEKTEALLDRKTKAAYQPDTPENWDESWFTNYE